MGEKDFLEIRYLFKLVMYGMEGWFNLYISPMGFVKMILIVLAAYVVVSYLDMRHIKKIPLTEALKNVEYQIQAEMTRHKRVVLATFFVAIHEKVTYNGCTTLSLPDNAKILMTNS